uniref:Uncharacterized protein n=1 Tax=Colletotrichum fructicola (strain Nara gc5) TaxID=1213859 RepID=L2G1A6_COLFN
MSSTRISPILEAWYKWKSLRLPWRKRFLIGRDLQGYTYWEFREQRGDGPGRFRRIVHYPRLTYLSDVKVSPLWHQWLRHTRRRAVGGKAQGNGRPRAGNRPTVAGLEYGTTSTDCAGTGIGECDDDRVDRVEPNAINAEDQRSEEEIRTRSMGASQGSRGPQAWVPPAGKK